MTDTRKTTMRAPDLDNLFPERLLRAAMEFFATEALGAALIRQPGADPGAERPLATFSDLTLAALLPRREQEQALSYRLAKRRNEFLAGRISARLALAAFWAAKGCKRNLPGVAVVNDASGRPSLSMERPRPDDLVLPDISITHGGVYGAALAAETPCGIDLQEQRDTLLRVRDRYCLAEEDRLLGLSLPEVAPSTRLALLWTAKEAAKKACSCRWMPGFLDLRLCLPVRRHEGWHVLKLALTRAPEDILLPPRLEVLATPFHRYGLAVCILTKDRHAGTAGS